MRRISLLIGSEIQKMVKKTRKVFWNNVYKHIYSGEWDLPTGPVSLDGLNDTHNYTLNKAKGKQNKKKKK